MRDVLRYCGVLVVAGAASAWFFAFSADATPPPPGGADDGAGVGAERVDSASFEQWLPALREGAEVTFANKSSTAADTSLASAQPFAKTMTLGPLVGKDLQDCIETMENISRARFEDLHAYPTVTESGVAYELLQQAELLCAAEEHLAAAHALRDGDYFVTEPGRLPPPPPKAGIVQSTARQAGKRVIVSIVLPFAKHRRFGDAYHYKKQLWLNYPANAVDFWNRQDETWRRAASQRVAKADGHRGGYAESLWRRRYAPGGTVVEPETATLTLVR